MTIVFPLPYPGARAEPGELLRLADAYHDAADRLLPLGQKGDLASRAPGRLCAIHAIELYLGAFLRARGVGAARIRGFVHDLERYRASAAEHGLVLRQKTARHLCRIAAEREYLVARYDPAMLAVSPITRLEATLDELAAKVRPAILGYPGPRGAPKAATAVRAASPGRAQAVTSTGCPSSRAG